MTILLGIAANVLTVILVIGLGWLAYVLGHRRKLVSFFHLGKSRQVILYTSSLRVLRGGAVGVDGQPRSFSGVAIPQYEAKVVAAFQQLFNTAAPDPYGISGRLRHLRYVDIDVRVEPSPLAKGDVTQTATFVAIGSPAYNAASARIEEDLSPLARFSPDFGELELPCAPPISDANCCLVQRTADPSTGQTAFYLAGRSEAASAGAAYYLLRDWRRLAKRYGSSRPFCVVLRVTSPDGLNQELMYETA